MEETYEVTILYRFSLPASSEKPRCKMYELDKLVLKCIVLVEERQELNLPEAKTASWWWEEGLWNGSNQTWGRRSQEAPSPLLGAEFGCHG